MSRADAAPSQLFPPRTLHAVPDPAPWQPAPATPEPLWREIAGAALKERRLQQRRTLRQVADRAGVSPQYLSEIERARKEPSSEMLASLCGALGLTLADLLMAAAPQLIRRPGQSTRAATVVSPVNSRPTGPLLMAA